MINLIKPFQTAMFVKISYAFYSVVLYLFAILFLFIAVYDFDQLHYKPLITIGLICMKAIAVFIYRYFYFSYYYIGYNDSVFRFSFKYQSVNIKKEEIICVKSHNNCYRIKLSSGKTIRVLKEIKKLETAKIPELETMVINY